MADAFTWAVRFLHVLSGVMWVGGAFLWGMIIAPNVLKRGAPVIRRPFLEQVLAKFTRYMILAGTLTILSGFWVMGLIVGWDGISDAFQIPGYGIALGVGVVAAIAMFALGLFVTMPSGHRLLEVLRSMPAPAPGQPPSPPPAEVAALGKKLGIASLVGMILGTVALAGMVWAVNVVR